MAVMFALAALAGGLSVYLLTHTGGSLPGCGPESGCDAVLASKWSRWFKIPVSAPAAAVYGAIILALCFRVRWKWNVLVAAAIMILGAAIWFTGVQIVELHSICRWCVATHGIGAALACMLLYCAPRRPFSSLVAGAAAVALLVAGQVFYQPPTVHVSTWASGIPNLDEGKGPDRKISILQGRVRNLKPYDYPLIGSPDAPHILIYLFDYTCPHCHEQHKNLVKVRQRYGDQIAIIPMAVPLNSECNPDVEKTEERHQSACKLAKLSLALWRADRAKFEEFHEWMFAAEDMRPTEEARKKAIELVGELPLNAAMEGSWFEGVIIRHLGLYGVVSQMAQHRAIPMIVLRDMIVAGQPGSPEELFQLLETPEGGIKPPATTASQPASRPAGERGDAPG